MGILTKIFPENPLNRYKGFNKGLNMQTNLNFNPDWYKITKLISPNVLEVENTWFIKLKGVGDSTPKEELKKWLKEGNIVRVIPYWRNDEARIVSDVWLGNTHINRQFPGYKKNTLKKDNLIQAFKLWHSIKDDNVSEKMRAEQEFIEFFNTAWFEVPEAVQQSFKHWRDCDLPQRRVGPIPIGIDKMMAKREGARDQMIEDFNNWEKNNYE